MTRPATSAAQRQALVLGRNGTAMDRRRDARSRKALPQSDPIPRPTPPRGRGIEPRLHLLHPNTVPTQEPTIAVTM